MKYDHKKIEAKWQKKWLEDKTFKAHDDSKKPKYYQLETFPYPSAEGLHVGHPKGYIAEDIHARYMRMKGHEVLYTMGWDAFGLPTENYAIKVGKSPGEVAEANIKNFKRQLQMFGFSYDWDREINTSSPQYYKWTQWLFIQLFKKGLAYRAKAKVNWCPKDQTVLANEQVEGGKCERCGSEIEQREMEQWFFKITDYAERLLADLKGLDPVKSGVADHGAGWPASTIKRQEDWIGKSEGALIKFQVSGVNDQEIEIFTTRPDTLFGATYMVLAPEHPLIKDLEFRIENLGEVREYVERATHKTELQRQEEVKEKTGVELKGVKVINPATKEEIPIWIADYVLMGYGTGAIMAVPAHDERDFEFATKFKLPIRQVIAPKVIDEDFPWRDNKENTKRSIVHVLLKHPTEDKIIALRSKKFPWLTPITGGIEDGEDWLSAATREIKEETGYQNFRFVKKLPFKVFAEFYAPHKDVNRLTLCDFLFFELTDENKEEISEKEKALHDIEWLPLKDINKFTPVSELDFMIEFLKRGDYAYAGEGLLINSGNFDGMDSEKAKWEITKFVHGEKKVQYKLRDWSVSRQRYWGVPIPMIYCAKCGVVPVPEKDLPVLLPDLKDYRPKGMPPLASSKEFIKTKCPKCDGDAERSAETLDTFVDSSWYYMRYTDPHNDKEPFDKLRASHWLPVDLYVIGAEHTVLHLLYARFITKFLHNEGHLGFTEPFLKLRHQGLIRGEDGQKMSKSRGNVVNPDGLIKEFGADTLRIYEMFMGSFEEGAPWDPKGILGAERFLTKFWNFFHAWQEAYQRDIKKNPQNKTTYEMDGGNSRENILLNKTIKKVTEDIAAFKFNTAISAMMIFLNEIRTEEHEAKFGWSETKLITVPQIEKFIKILHPFAPHMAQELWSQLGHETILDFETWPIYDDKLIKEDKFTLVVQVNGRVRDTTDVRPDISEAEAGEIALRSERVKTILGGQKPKKIIYVPKKLINIVT